MESRTVQRPASPESRNILKRVFGFDEFRLGQEEVIGRLEANRPVLAIFPTGGGKSLCYQLPALLLPGLTLVISPLIALMKDQVDALRKIGVAAARLDSSLENDVAERIIQDAQAGRLRLLYIAPERLANERFLQSLSRVNLAMLAIDEAHCISEWGHNFRPDYLKIARLARSLQLHRILCLTATATPAVAGDIAKSFGILKEDIIRTGSYRPNLQLNRTPCPPAEKLPTLLARLKDRTEGSAIVYVTLQKSAESVARQLSSSGFPARAYHAGLEAEERHEIQDHFMKSPSDIVVATIAFGMGIDKPDIRSVYHYDLPKSLENYSQEVGRAGRDGLHSVCEMFVCPADRIVLENFILGDTPTPEAITALLNYLLSLPSTFDVSLYELSGLYDIRPLVLETLLTYLELLEVIESTGPFYCEYRFQPLRSSKEILARFDPKRGAFLGDLFRQAVKGKTWFNINLDLAAKRMGEPRQRLAAALSYLADKGDLILKPSRARQGYRKRSGKVDWDFIGQQLVERFERREARDLERLDQILDYANHRGCATAYLLNYFGDHGPQVCGHCGDCLGQISGASGTIAEYQLDFEDARVLEQLIGEGHGALESPRQLTRFLCGLNSPAATRARLGQHREFGRLAEVPFRRVLAWVEAVIEG